MGTKTLISRRPCKRYYAISEAEIVLVLLWLTVKSFGVFLLTSQLGAVGLLAQLVRALHRYRRGQGSNPGKPDFFRLSRNCISCLITARIFFTFNSSFRSSNI